MSEESNIRDRLRQRTLAEFDRASLVRRVRSRVGAAALILICAAAVILTREVEQTAQVSVTPVVALLPAYVEIIETDDELLEALRDAGRCEGLMRQGAIVTLIACDLGS
ncbi:MAG: hypothetical protein RLZZ386_1237 [Planctomycetota bacterium]